MYLFENLMKILDPILRKCIYTKSGISSTFWSTFTYNQNNNFCLKASKIMYLWDTNFINLLFETTKFDSEVHKGIKKRDEFNPVSMLFEGSYSPQIDSFRGSWSSSRKKKSDFHAFWIGNRVSPKKSCAPFIFTYLEISLWCQHESLEIPA